MTTLRLLRVVAIVWAASALYAASAPVPLVDNPLVPGAIAPGSGGFTLTVNGTGFVANSVVNWNGSPRATTFGTRSQLTAAILASDVAAAGTASVTVTNPAPGGGTSNVVFFQVATPAMTVGMAATANFGIANPGFVTAADLNGDGKLDLVISYFQNGSPQTYGVAILLGNGDGTFRAPASFPIGAYAYSSIVVADFNDDGKLDLAVAEDGGFDILLGNGDGTMQPFQHVSPNGVNVASLAAGDFNGDGKLDLAVGGNESDLIGVLLGNGDGTFQTVATYPGLPESYGLVAGDFNQDGILDLAVTGSNNGGVGVLLGNGDGSFRAPIATGGPVCYGLAAADFNGDGILDLATGGSTGTIWLGLGNGKFKPAVGYPMAQYTGQTPITGDFNGDGRQDVAILAGEESAGALFILLGNGDGTFQPALSTAGSVDPYSLLVAGDFNGDGLLDIATPLSLNLQTTVALSPGLLTFSPTLEGASGPAKTVTLTNLGASPLGISQVAVSGPNPTEFVLSNNNCQGAMVPVAGNCTVDIAFAPLGLAQRDAVLAITDSASVNPQTTALVGNGTPIQLTPAKLNFGSVKVGQISAQQIIRARNTTSSLVDIQGIFMVDRNSKDFLVSNTCGSSLKPKTTCSIVVQFIPAKKGAAKAATSFSVKDATEDNPKTIPVSGTGLSR